MDNTDKKNEIMNLIRHGKETGYILNSDFNSSLKNFPDIDKKYVKETLVKLEIQLVEYKGDYDEYKYLSGEEAIEILQSLSDGTHQAFIDRKNTKKK